MNVYEHWKKKKTKKMKKENCKRKVTQPYKTKSNSFTYYSVYQDAL